MKRIGYIQGLRIRGPVSLGPLGSLVVPLTIDVTGISHLRGLAIMYAGFITAGSSTLGGPSICSSSFGVGGVLSTNQIICNSSLGVAGPTTLNGAVICSSSLQIAVGGLLRFPQVTNATDLPAAAGALPSGSLWANANVITRVP